MGPIKEKHKLEEFMEVRPPQKPKVLAAPKAPSIGIGKFGRMQDRDGLRRSIISTSEVNPSVACPMPTATKKESGNSHD